MRARTPLDVLIWLVVFLAALVIIIKLISLL